jgi:hypothetical protein
MLIQVIARTPQGNGLSLPLDESIDGILVDEIEGLDPVKATLVTSSFATLDGEQYQSSRREARNIVLHLTLEPDYVDSTVSSLRGQLYGFFMPKSEVVLSFVNSNGLSVSISGRVESFETPLFTAEPMVDISIMCFDPDFVDMQLQEFVGTTVSTETEGVIDYPGTVESGLYTFKLMPDRPLTDFTIYHRPPGNDLRMLQFSGDLIANDVLTISTMAGSKGAVLTRAGVDSSVLYSISPQSNWIELQPGGENHIRVYAEGAAIPYQILYLKRYGGL